MRCVRSICCGALHYAKKKFLEVFRIILTIHTNYTFRLIHTKQERNASVEWCRYLSRLCTIKGVRVKIISKLSEILNVYNLKN
jgi:hypothetical protein